MLGGLCGFSPADGGQPLPDWTEDGLRLLDALYEQLANCEERALPLLQRLFQGTWQPFGEALEAWLFAGEGFLPMGSPFAAALPSDMLDLLPDSRRKQASPVSRGDWLYCGTRRSPHVLT